MMKKLLIMLLLGSAMNSYAEGGQGRSLVDSLHYRMEMQTTLSSGKTPLWLHSNR